MAAMKGKAGVRAGNVYLIKWPKTLKYIFVFHTKRSAAMVLPEGSGSDPGSGSGPGSLVRTF